MTGLSRSRLMEMWVEVQIWRKWYQDVPATCDTANQIMQFCYGLEVKKVYVFNIPRAMKQDGRNLAKILSSIESIKDGILYDTRYRTQQKFIESPQIIVILNHLPELDLLSTDRWKIMVLKSNGEFEIKSSTTVLRTFTSTTTSAKYPEKPSFLIKKKKISQVLYCNR